ncbi:MAG TPA: hypothetical protein VFC39_09190 [Acidobacteriaceae bacterium]|nr:hypothetical protein [Acidobacteriaceae bacterium]
MAQETAAPQTDVEQQESDYDTWFRKEVEEGLREADDPNTVWFTQEEVMNSTAERLEMWRQKHLQKKAS